MTNYAQHTSNSRLRRSLPPQSQDDTSLVKSTVSPSEIVTQQALMGNRAVQRALKNSPAPLVKSISRAPVGAQRTIQRNVFHSMVKGFARKNIFGKNTERRAITQDTATTKKKNSHVFADIKDVSVKNGKHNLAGRYYTAKKVKNPTQNDIKYAGHTVLFMSGSGGSAENYGLELAKFYCRRGADFVAVNYRGFGGSTMDTKTLTGKATTKQIDNSDITEDGLYSDAYAIFKWLMGEGVSADKTMIHGYSLGGPVAAQLTARLAEEGVRVGGLILESPMDSVKEQAKQAAPTRGIGSFVANSSGVVMDLRTHLGKLASIDGFKDLAIHFMSGKSANGDQLGLDKTKLDQDTTKMGFTNVAGTQAGGADHEDVKKHAEIAEKGANTYDNPATSLDRLFKTAEPLVVSDDVKPEVSEPKDEIVVDLMMNILSEETQQEVVKEQDKETEKEKESL